MNFGKLRELLLTLEKYSDEHKVIMMDVYENYVNVYFEKNNIQAMEIFEWEWSCEMHNSNDSYVRVNF